MNPERRIYPRVNVKIAAELSGRDGETADVTLINLSQIGMLVEGGMEMKALKPPVAGVPLELYLHFSLEDGPVHCHCRVVYQQRQSQQCLRYGLSVLSVDQQASERLQTFIHQHIK